MLNRISPTRDIMALREAMNRLFDDSFSHAASGEDRIARLPIDVYGTENEFVVLVAVPGVSLDNINITVERETLTISGEIPEPLANVEYVYNERFYGKFLRNLRLSAPVDVDKIEATLENGVLKLILPKAEAAKPRQIEIKTK